MKNTFKVQFARLFITALVMAIGFSMAACGGGGGGDPVLTGTVSISGTAEAGQTLTANTTLLDGSGAITYQWKRGTAVIGANSSVYQLTTADIGGTITVTVTRSGYSGSITSAPTAVVTNPSLPALTGTVSIDGTAEVGQTLMANTSSLGGSGTITCQWKRGGTVIGTSSSYTVQAADVGSTITVTVTRSDNSGHVISDPVVVIDPSLSTLSGTITISPDTGVIIGTELTATYNGNETVSYQWKKDGVNVGINSNKYTPTEAGSYAVTVNVTGYNPKTSNSVTVTSPALTGTVSIIGIAQVDQTLTANTYLLGGSGDITYLWKRGGTVIGTNDSSYTVQTVDVGSTITVTVTRSGYSGSVTSVPTAVVLAEDPPTPGLYFMQMGGSYSVSQGSATAADVVIPALYEGLPVTAIANNGFSSYTNMTSIRIPSRVTSIGVNAFSNCTSLTSIAIPNSVTNIGSGAFVGCTGLTSVTVPFLGSTLGGASAHIGYIFGAPSYSGQDSYIPPSLKTVIITGGNSIPANAFSGCTGLTSVIVPGETGASSGWSVTIPNSITSIGQGAFSGCTGLTNITIPFVGAALNGTSNTHFGYIFGAPGYSGQNSYIPASLKTVIITGGSSIPGNAFNGCTGLTNVIVPGETGASSGWSVTIPNNILSINAYAFQGCIGLTSITIPDSVTSIASYVFSGCSGLTDIPVLPAGITTIEAYTFQNCTGLTNVTIPDRITRVGYRAFEGTTYLTSITLNGISTLTEEGGQQNFSSIFNGFDGVLPWSLKTVVITGSRIAYMMFKNCTGLTSVTISNSVTSIEWGAFSGCTGLTSIIIPNGVTSIGVDIDDHIGVFDGCTNLTNVTIPASVTGIGAGAFAGCTKLTSIAIPNDVTSIGNATFSGCTNLASVTIGNSVTSIGFNAFWKCASLTNVTIPNSVKNIGQGAFAYCANLASVNIPNGVTSIGEEAFRETKLTGVTIPNSVISIGRGAFAYCASLTSITIPFVGATLNGIPDTDYGITSTYFGHIFGGGNEYVPASLKTVIITGGNSIPASAFSNCAGLTNITIPNSVKSIEEYAFVGTSLTSVIIPNEVESIGLAAFQGCTSLTGITIPDSVTSIGQNAFYDTVWLDNQPNGLVYAGKVAYTYQGAMPANTRITLLAGTKGIADWAFGSDYSTSLIEITIPDSVTSIGAGAFSGCTNLTIYLDSGNANYSLDQGVLYNKNKTVLHTYPAGKSGSFSIPNSVASIEDYAFVTCYGLTSVNIPNSVKNIGISAFSYCYGLTSITIPNSVITIGEEAFNGCRFTSVTFLCTITADNFADNAFGTGIYNGLLYLRGKYLAEGTGTYTRPDNTSTTWTKQ